MEKSSLSPNADVQKLQQHDTAAALAKFKEDSDVVTKLLDESLLLIEKQQENLRMITVITLQPSKIRDEYSCYFFNHGRREQNTDEQRFDRSFMR